MSGAATTTKYDLESLKNAVRTFLPDGEVREVRVPKAGKQQTISGFFNDRKKLLQALAELSGEHEGVYITLNPVNPDLLALPNNCWKPYAKSTTADPDVLRRNWLLIDIDSKRKAGISSTDEEKAGSKALAEQVRDYLRAQAWAEPLLCDSGNGWHLLYRIDLPNDAASRDLIHGMLDSIAGMFDTPTQHVDTTVHNASRIVKAYGTMSCKGDSIPSRPHRIGMMPSHGELTLVTPDQLRVVARLVPQPEMKKSAAKGGWTYKMVVALLALAGIKHKAGLEYRGGWKWQLTCLDDPAHECPDAFIMLDADGWISYKCSHDSCKDLSMNSKELLGAIEEMAGKPFPESPMRELSPEDVFGADAVDEDEPISAATADAIDAMNVPGDNLKGTLCPKCSRFLIVGAFDRECSHCKKKAALKKGQLEGEESLVRGKRQGSLVSLDIISAETIQMEELMWLWRGRIPASKITLFAGLGDCLKSTVLIDLIARITTGRDFPDGVKNEMEPRRVLLAFTEDDAKDTVIPKLTAAGADLSMVKIISKVTEVDEEGELFRRSFNLKDHLYILEEALKKHSDFALVALDPISGFWGGVDSNKDDDMRPVLESLKELCSTTRTAVVGIMHLNKKSELKSSQRVSGAGAIANVTRAIWMFAPDPENKDEYYMSKGKGHVIPRGVKGLKYATSNVPITLGNGKPGTSFRIEWLGEHDFNADDVAQKDKDVQKNGGGTEVTMFSQMKLILRAELEKGQRLATEMYRMGEAEWGEDSGKTLKRAHVAIGGLTTKTKPYYWYLPGHEPVEAKPRAEDPKIPDVEVM